MRPGGRVPRPQPGVRLRFLQRLGAEVSGAKIRYVAEGVPHSAEGGLLIAGAEATWQPAPDPIATTGTVSWRTADGKDHKLDVEVASKVKDLKRFTGVIWLKFTKDGGVEVIPMTYDEQDKRAKEGKGILPD